MKPVFSSSFQESIAAKSKWKAAFKAVKAKKSDMPTAEEAYDFFTRNFDPDSEDEEKTSTSKPEDGEEAVPDEDEPGPSSARDGEEPKSARDKKKDKKKKEEEEEEKEEDEQPLLSDHFLDHEDWKDRPSEWRPAKYIPLRDREEAEEGFYFVPSSRYSKSYHSDEICWISGIDVAFDLLPVRLILTFLANW